MIRYLVYAVNDRNEQYTVKKIKREYEAINFVNDVKNLSRYGCMNLVKETDTEGQFWWNNELSAWIKMEA